MGDEYPSDLDDDITDDELDEGQDEEETLEATMQQREVGKETRALQFLNTSHPECRLDYLEDVLQKLPLTSYPPDSKTDAKHKSVPYLTIYEKTKIIGFRANQLSQGARPFIERPPHITDVLEIARLELEQKRLPFIIKRPMPDGTFEYWRLNDLMIV